MKNTSKKYTLTLIICFVSINSFATKISPISLEELLDTSIIAAVVKIEQASISNDEYEIFHSGEKKNYLSYSALITDSIKGVGSNKTTAFYSREPLLIGRDYLVFLNRSDPNKLFVAQAGFAAFEKTYIPFKDAIKESVRAPSDYISIAKELPTLPGTRKLNEQSSNKWLEWLVLKKWITEHLSATSNKKN